MKILRDQPDTLQDAVATCTNEQNLRTRGQMSHHGLSSTHTPMEVDHSRGQRYKYGDKYKKVNSTSKRPIKCRTCGQMGHTSRAKKERRPPMGHGQSRRSASQSNNQGN